MRINQRLNVGLVFDDSLDSNDGVAQNVKNIGAWLSKRGHQVSYLVGETKLDQWANGKVYSLAKNQTVRFNGNRLSMPLFAKTKDLKRVMDECEFDVLHITVPYSPMMGERLIKMASPTTAVVGTFHIMPAGFVSKSGSRLLGFWLRNSLRRIDAMVSVSKAAAEFAKKYYGINGEIISNPVDLKKFKVKQADKNFGKDLKIVFLGRLVKRKGALQLIEAFAQLINDGIDANLVIAGDGPQRAKLESKVRSLKLENKVKFLGFIAESYKPALLASADVACFPSLYGEAFGIVLIEAMAAGAKTILAGNNPGYRSVLNEQPYTLINPTITNDFTNRLIRLLTDKDLIKQLSKWQTETVKQYDINVVGRQVEELYLDAIARRTKKSNNKAHE